MKQLFIGGINRGNQPRGGEEYKNQLLIKKIENSTIIDTHRWLQNPLVWVNLIFSLFFKRWNNIILSTSSLSTFRLLRIIDVLKPSILKKITYLVIGGYFPEAIRNKRYKWEYYKKLKNVIVEGELLKINLQAHSKLNNIKVIPNFKDFPVLENFKDQRKSAFSFIYIGRISQSKGIREIIEAAKELQNRGLEFTIDFFGPLENDFDFSETFMAYKGFLDFQKLGRESYEYISNYDCMLFPTYWQGEGFPGVIIDAFIAGLPVIASDWNMNKELIEEGVNGFIVPAKNTEALREKMEFVVHNQNILKEIRYNNLLKAKNYHIDVVYSRIEEALN